MNKNVEKIRDQSTEELEVAYLEASRELFGLRNELSANKKLDKPHLLTDAKKRRARILTVINERKNAEAANQAGNK